jgi:RimJ/RimL family protein N-acetyltransferase
MYLENTYTKRLFIRKVTSSDIDPWAVFFDNKESAKYTGIDVTLDSKSLSKIWIDKQLWRYENNKYGHHALIEKNSGTLVGLCGLLTQNINDKKEIEIAYHILPKYRNKGFATEAALIFRDYAFNNNITDSLVSVIHEENISSQNVAFKIGMKKTELVTNHEMIFYNDGKFYIYRVNKKDLK